MTIDLGPRIPMTVRVPVDLRHGLLVAATVDGRAGLLTSTARQARAQHVIQPAALPGSADRARYAAERAGGHTVRFTGAG